MAWTLTHDVGRYTAAALPLLATDSVRHTIALTVVAAAQARDRPPPDSETYGWWTEPDGRVTGAVSVTPPFPPLLEVVPEHALAPLVDALGDRVTGVSAPVGTAITFAALWTSRSHGQAVLARSDRLFRLDTVVPPDPAPEGSSRAASDRDVPLLARWLGDFGEELGLHTPDDATSAVRERLGWDGFWLWCDPTGVPVSMAGLNRPASGAVRLGPVFTPPEHRGHGYAAGATVAASLAALRLVDTVVLFTDQANPTSNALYQRIGYRPVEDRALFTFLPPGAPVRAR
jgi:RimJ/RimL family protein N-acetyltransferase